MEIKREKRGITPKKLQSWIDVVKQDSSSLDEESASTLETLEQVSTLLQDFHIDKVVKIEPQTDKQHLEKTASYVFRHSANFSIHHISQTFQHFLTQISMSTLKK